MIYDDEADAFDLAEDAELAQTLDKAAAKIVSRKVGDERFHDVFAVSGLAMNNSFLFRICNTGELNTKLQ